MMAGRRDWAGTPEEMLEALSRFRDHTDATGWPSGPAAFAEALKELEPILARVGLLIARTDDGRLLIHRQSDESAGGGSYPLPFSRPHGWFEPVCPIDMLVPVLLLPSDAAAVLSAASANVVQAARPHLQKFCAKFFRSGPFVQVCMQQGGHSPSSSRGCRWGMGTLPPAVKFRWPQVGCRRKPSLQTCPAVAGAKSEPIKR